MKEKTQAQLASLAQTRDTLVKLRTALKNKVNNILSAHGANLEREALGTEKKLKEILAMKFDAMVQLELEVLIEAFYVGGTFDQVNIGCLLSFEILARRVQTIVDAYAADPSGAFRKKGFFTIGNNGQIKRFIIQTPKSFTYLRPSGGGGRAGINESACRIAGK